MRKADGSTISPFCALQESALCGSRAVRGMVFWALMRKEMRGRRGIVFLGFAWRHYGCGKERVEAGEGVGSGGRGAGSIRGVRRRWPRACQPERADAQPGRVTALRRGAAPNGPYLFRLIRSYLGTSAILPPKRRDCLVLQSRRSGRPTWQSGSKRGDSGQRFVSPQQRVLHARASREGPSN